MPLTSSVWYFLSIKKEHIRDKAKKKKKITSGNLQIQAPFCSQPTAVDHSCEQQSLGCRWPKLLSTSQGNTAITRENPLFWSIRSKTQAVFDLCSTDTHVRHSCVGCTYTSVYTVNVHTQLAAVESFFKHSEDTQMLVFTLP